MSMKHMLYYGQRTQAHWIVANSQKPSYEDLQARIADLEAQLEAIGAGGVSGQRITKKGEDKMKQQKIWLLTETVRHESNRTFVAAFARKPSHKKLLQGGYLGKYASDQSIADLLKVGISDPDMFDTWFCLDRVNLD